MAKTKHTPGPWEIWHHQNSNKSGLKSLGKQDGVRMLEADGSFEPHFTITNGQHADHTKHNIQGSWIGAHICEISYPPNGINRGFAEAKANAKLIAAAPEMFEALQNIIHWHGHRGTDEKLKPLKDQPEEIQKAIIAIQNAIVKSQPEPKPVGPHTDVTC